MELLKTANALLGFNQVSLAKYLMIAAKEDNPKLDVNKVPEFFTHIMERVRLDRDLHFQTSTTTDTLDYTGGSLNHGSKLVIAAAGPKVRDLRNEVADLQSLRLPATFADAKIVMPGVVALKWNGGSASFEAEITTLKESLAKWSFRENYPWISVVDDTSTLGMENPQTNLRDFLWLTFTRSDPARDLYGLNERVEQKHWTTDAPLIVDARIKPHHQKAITFDESVREKALQKLQGIL
jgi:4-hydroxy-3-polyprenylbenzoate decarboxylase